MTTTLHLVGGGPGAMLALRRHFKAALAELGRPHPLVAYVGAASDDNSRFFAMMRGALAASSARMRLAKVASPRASASDARSLLEECDLVFMSGGDVDHGMQVLNDRDMAGFLVALGRAGKPMFGISAGSLMLARDWVRFPEDDEARAELFPCLGLAPLHVDAHSEDDGWSELRVLVRLLHERGDENPVGYGLTRHGGLLVSADGDHVAVRPVGTPIPRFVVRRGRVVEAADLPLPP
ncbi:MAG TPA: Type 1 glutamine amidotransferase-like domain-containing protein [Polyangiaceae bacterium]|jgi:peptidase E